MTTDAGEDVEKEEHFSTVGGVVNWYNNAGNSLAIPQKIGHSTI